ncbi:8275_t:CDS:1, partial [Funneliformis geosporum]
FNNFQMLLLQAATATQNPLTLNKANSEHEEEINICIQSA